MIAFITNPDEKARIAGEILAGLPEWFGIPESTANYIAESRSMPFWATMRFGEPTGFIALKETAPRTAEIFVMGVRKDRHRRGDGTLLWEAFRDFAQACGYEYAQVKTVRRGCYETYDRTNDFYEHIGFRALECFPTLWDECNPCQIYVQYIG
ncbi:MAG: GNAT family N-acetyltransferase [Christensenellaceae bacterium]|nr:GNAT family N-acetyltransferase [Christensenellaceae bacterium]